MSGANITYDIKKKYTFLLKYDLISFKMILWRIIVSDIIKFKRGDYILLLLYADAQSPLVG
ncbi:MAG: hypothetical protein ACFFG0_42280 [Candidatus Thorarchaeota archaeon]